MRRSVLAALLLNSGISSPLALSNLWGWWDASDLSTLYLTNAAATHVASDGDLCGYAADKSGNGRNATCIDAVRSTWKTNVQNSKGALLFGVGASGKHLSTATAPTNTNITLAAVMKAPATITGGTTYGAFSTLDTSGAVNGTNLQINSSGAFVSRTSPTDVTITGATPTISTAYVVGIQVSSTATNKRILRINNNAAVTSTTAVTSSDQIVRIGCQNVNNTNNFWTGHICEVVVYSPGLSDVDTLALMAWLSNKWQI